MDRGGKLTTKWCACVDFEAMCMRHVIQKAVSSHYDIEGLNRSP